MKEYLRLILILLLPLTLLVAYSLSGYRLFLNDLSVSKLRGPARWLDSLTRKDMVPPTDSVRSEDTAAVQDTLPTTIVAEEPDTMPLDTARKRILFFGDSMVEGLSMRFSDYAMENGHQLYSVCWYGSSIAAWATATDTIASMLEWARPDYVVVSLGGNELRTKELESRRENILKIEAQLDSLPIIWIAPPSWVRKPTITGLILSVVGKKRYFDSTRLTYTRGSDNMHPTFNSSARWMDSIAVWMSSAQSVHPIVMNPPKQKYPRKWKKRFIFPES